MHSLAVLDAAGLSVDQARGELGGHPRCDRRINEAQCAAHHEAERVEQVDVRFGRHDELAQFGDRHADQCGGELHSQREMQATDAFEEARMQAESEAEQEAGVPHQREQRTVGEVNPLFLHAELFGFLHRPVGVEAEQIERKVGADGAGEQEGGGCDVLVSGGHLEFGAVVEHQIGDQEAEYAADDHLMRKVRGYVQTRNGNADDHQQVGGPDWQTQFLHLLAHQNEIEDDIKDGGGHHCVAAGKAGPSLAGHRKLFEWGQVETFLILDRVPIRTAAKAVRAKEEHESLWSTLAVREERELGEAETQTSEAILTRSISLSG